MTLKPVTWIEEDRSEIVEKIVDGVIKSLSEKEMLRIVWDMLYDDLIYQDWSDLFMRAEEYAPELLEGFNGPESKLA